MAANRFGAACAACDTYVPPNAGVLRREDAAWRTYCEGCEPAQTAQAAQPAPLRGTHGGWHTGPLVSFDLETSGVDVHGDFVVTAAVCEARGTSRTWLVDPGPREIPEQATAVHGITTERARAHGRPVKECLEEVAAVLAGHLAEGTPVVVYNAAFDLTVLRSELLRHGLPTLEDRVGRVAPVVDPYIVDKQYDRFRRGKRALSVTCAHYGVTLADDAAHTADGDARACLLLARELGARFAELGALDPVVLHERQCAWAAQQARSFQEYLDRVRPGHGEHIDGDWPVRALPAQV